MAVNIASSVACHIVEEAVVWAVRMVKLPLPETAIRVAVRALGEWLTLDDVREVLGVLGISQLASSVEERIPVLMNRDEESPTVEVECPESGDTILLDEGDGEYTCPDCTQDIVVENAEGTHASPVVRPVADESFWVGPEEADYECPHCGLAVSVDAGFADHEEPLEVDCPESGDTILVAGEGEHRCPDCGQGIVAEDGEAFHAVELECPVKRRSFWVGPEEGDYQCPLCGLEVELEEGAVVHQAPVFSMRPGPARRLARK